MAEASASSNASAFFAGNQHNDVLSAKPDSEEARVRLVEELKRRGNAAFKFQSFPEAEVLYAKAIEHDGNNAALFGNRSMTRASMGRFQEALEDANAAIGVDPSWVKGYYRKAMAELGLKKFAEAETSFKRVLELDASNKAAKTELAKIPEARKKYEEEAARIAERKAAEAAEEAERAKSRVISKKIVEGPASSAATSAKAAKKKSSGKEDDLSLRGYRTLADGRKTTFFNRELSEEDKALLKDNKPKQVQTTEEIAEQERRLREGGASAWNQGGTFEEKTMTEWARKRLKELLVGTQVSVPVQDSDGDVLSDDITVTDLTDLDGDASITFTRGKRRHIFDFNFNASWKLDFDGKTITGSLFFPDVSGDVVQDDELVETELRWSNRDKAGPGNEDRIKSVLMDSSEKGLHGALNRAIHAFAAEFREMN
mmetsp:Transcript_14577/g.41374  ORF Transcript_14577/g.41374 Transcript_14577/m.41374 type:complete len:428 (-) Transcript_14577:169-1452(-)